MRQVFEQRNSSVPTYAPHLFYASGDSDVRHRISLSGGWDLPFDRAWAAGPKRLTKGWSVYPIFTYRTGFPYDISAQLPDSIDPDEPGYFRSGRSGLIARGGSCADKNVRSQARADDSRDHL